jgi:hypothetical protein
VWTSRRPTRPAGQRVNAKGAFLPAFHDFAARAPRALLQLLAGRRSYAPQNLTVTGIIPSMPSHPAVLTPPSRLPKVKFLTERQLATLVKVTPETLRAWRRRGEMPPVAVGPEVDAFVARLKIRGRAPVCYRCSDVSAWLFGNGGPGGRPKPLPASAFDPANDRTAQLRRAGQAAKNAGDAAKEKRIRRQLTDLAKFAARLGFASPTAYEEWLKRGAPENELPPECRPDPDALIADDESCERLQLLSDTAIAKIRHVSPSVVTAERRRTEPLPPPQPAALGRTATPDHDARRAAALRRARELERALPVSTTTLHNEALQRRAEELGPIEGF